MLQESVIQIEQREELQRREQEKIVLEEQRKAKELEDLERIAAIAKGEAQRRELQKQIEQGRSQQLELAEERERRQKELAELQRLRETEVQQLELSREEQKSVKEDIAIIKQKQHKIIFITQAEYEEHPDIIANARLEGYEFQIVSHADF